MCWRKESASVFSRVLCVPAGTVQSETCPAGVISVGLEDKGVCVLDAEQTGQCGSADNKRDIEQLQ